MSLWSGPFLDRRDDISSETEIKVLSDEVLRLSVLSNESNRTNASHHFDDWELYPFNRRRGQCFR